METKDFLLFMACLIFAGFNLFANIKTGGITKPITYIGIIAGIMASLYILAKAF